MPFLLQVHRVSKNVSRVRQRKHRRKHNDTTWDFIKVFRTFQNRSSGDRNRDRKAEMNISGNRSDTPKLEPELLILYGRRYQIRSLLQSPIFSSLLSKNRYVGA